MYKVFINDKPLFFSEKKHLLNDYDRVIFFKYKNGVAFYNEILHHLNNDIICCVIGQSPLEMLYDFFKEYNHISAAGGVVRNNSDQLLFIFRNNLWDLPKGKIEKNEDQRTAAVREVEEECGLIGPTIIDDLISTFHTYEFNGEKYLKRTYWYGMKYEKEHVLIPQIEEGITKVEWINISNLNNYTNNTYESIKSVIGNFLIKG